jgi:type III pantothenate kinase
MLLAVDIGNTNIVIGLFNGKRLISKQRILSKPGSKINIKAGKIDSAMIASVVPSLTKIVSDQIFKRYGVRPSIIDWRSIKGIPIASKKKHQIGADRLVNAVAAKKLYGTPAIIIDLGTATTFCAVNKAGNYLGGAITSGLAISRDVLHERTAKLPLIEIKRPMRCIGRDTVEAMRSGLYFGYIEMLEGMIRRFKKELGKNAIVVVTGGLSHVIAKGSKMIDVVDEDLTLKGLNIIYQMS